MANSDLRLSDDNLYSDGEVISLKDQRLLLKRARVVYPNKSRRDINHRVIEGETLSQLAHKYYGDSKLWYYIADVNKVYNPLELTRGDILLIPDIDTFRNLRR